MRRLFIGCACALLVGVAAAGEFRAGGDLVSPRVFHTATLLRDGRVLLAGGEGQNGALLASAEVFDPATGRFAALPDMPAPRRGHVAVRLDDGRVLIAGGDWGPVGRAGAFLFDPASGRFEPGATLSTPQVGTAAALLPDGRVLLVGGQAPFVDRQVHVAPAEIYDPRLSRFSLAPSPVVTGSLYPEAKGPLWPKATRLADGRVLVTGNVTAEVFDAARGEFVAVGTTRDPVLRFGSFWHTSTLLADGGVLVTGGHDEFQFSAHAQRFDPASGTFTLVGKMSAPRALHTATLLLDGSVLVTGGETWVIGAERGWFGGSLATSERFDPATGEFLPDAGMSVARVGHTATLLHDGRVLVAGGTDFPGYAQAASREVAGSAELYVDLAACTKPAGRARCGAK